MDILKKEIHILALKACQEIDDDIILRISDFIEMPKEVLLNQINKFLTYKKFWVKSDLKQGLKELKEQFVWLREIEAQAICQSYLNINSSFDRFFKGQSKHPRFHSKRGKNSYKSCSPSQTLISWTEHTIKIPKVGKTVLYIR